MFTNRVIQNIATRYKDIPQAKRPLRVLHKCNNIEFQIARQNKQVNITIKLFLLKS